MTEQILLSVAAVLAVIGLVSLIDALMMLSVKPSRNEKYFAVCVFDADDKNPSLTVSLILSKLMRSGEYGRCTVVAVDKGMDENRRTWLAETFSEEKHVIICDENELDGIIFEKRQ